MSVLFALTNVAVIGWTSFCKDDSWVQVWADEFEGTVLNESVWNIDTAGGDSKVRNSQGTRDNVYVEGGALVLRSQRQKVGKYNYTSGAVETQGKASWRGLTRACVSAKLPGGEGQSQPNSSTPDWCATTPFGACRTGCPFNLSGTCGPDKQPFGPGKGSCNECVCNKQNTSCSSPANIRPDSKGVWPAHWMMPDNNACWPSNGEIDIMEMINGEGVTHATYHWRPRAEGGCGDKCANGTACPHPSIGSSHPDRVDTTIFHEYAVEYDHTHIHFAFDGVIFQSINASTVGSGSNLAEFFDVPYYMILNTAVGGPWPGEPTEKTVFPLHHTIDYVRVAQPKAQTIQQ